MKPYEEMNKEELLKEKETLLQEHKKFCDMGLKLDMSRGKPSKAQLELSMPMLDVLTSKDKIESRLGTDLRNYGVLDGIDEAKELMGAMVGTSWENVIIYGNASLNCMYDCITRSMLHGVCGETPWCKLDEVKFLCPVPGYDRHFAITESFGIKMINIPLYEDGPDMDMVENYVNNDPSVKGIWCVPKYSNPMGTTYSEETVQRFAHLKPAAKDFRIYWDNAYVIHHLYEDEQDTLPDIIEECAKAGNPDIVYEFCSTSKVTFSGSGISAIATSYNNREDIKKQLTIQTIGFDKINQLRHCKFFGNFDGMKKHMMKHAAILRPKFELILDQLEKEIAPVHAGTWAKPKGGYFIAFFAHEGCAKDIVAKAKEAGVIMTPAGAPYPYHKDPKDSCIRIAPSLPPIEELEQACEIFINCTKLSTVEKLLGEF